jgi:hypothetical protein
MGLRVKSWIKKVNINLFFLREGGREEKGEKSYKLRQFSDGVNKIT